jgi:hypothetical protein
VDEARVPTPEVTLTVVESPCLDGARACIAPWDAVLWLDPGSATREDFLHEVGHAEDYFALPDWMRWRFMSLLVLTGEWNPQPETQFSPAEQFADVYAECAVVPYIDRKQRLGPGPVFGGEPIGGRVTHNRICRMLARA